MAPVFARIGIEALLKCAGVYIRGPLRERAKAALADFVASVRLFAI